MIDVEINRPENWLDDLPGFYEALYHDLKTPMTVLFNYVKIMESDKELSDASRARLAAIKRATLRIAKLVQDANDRARMNHGLITPEYKKIDGIKLVSRICEDANAALLNAKLVFSSSRKTCELYLDEKMLERILLNILANAKDFSEEGGLIECETRADDMRFMISVRDYGKGAKGAKEVFARHSGRTKRGLRSGLGLYITREFINLMDGEILFMNANPGVRIVMSLPIIEREEAPKIERANDFFYNNVVSMELTELI